MKLPDEYQYLHAQTSKLRPFSWKPWWRRIDFRQTADIAIQFTALIGVYFVAIFLAGSAIRFLVASLLRFLQ